MSATPEYWAYRTVPGMENERQQREGAAEGRRAFALKLAVQWDDTNEGVLARAQLFEEYLKGDAADAPDGD